MSCAPLLTFDNPEPILMARTIPERLQIFYGRLAAASAASTAEEALEQITQILNAVEDEFSGLPYDPPSWREKRRLYPPDPAFERDLPEWPAVRKFRQTGHSTFIGANGSRDSVRQTSPSGRRDRLRQEGL